MTSRMFIALLAIFLVLASGLWLQWANHNLLIDNRTRGIESRYLICKYLAPNEFMREYNRCITVQDPVVTP